MPAAAFEDYFDRKLTTEPMRTMKLQNRVVRSVVAIALIGGLATALANDHSIVETSIVGTWALEVSGPRGVQHSTLKVAEDKGVYHGAYTGQRGQVLIEEIQVEKNTFSFPLKVTTPMGTFELRYNGQIDADLMQGKIDTPRNAMPFTGKRKK